MEAVRLGSDFSFSVSIDEGIDVQACRIPSLILQPVVENAIWHGVSKLGGKGSIELVLRRYGKLLEILVMDNGPGPDTSNRNHNKEKHSLDILHERVELMGTEHHCETSLEVAQRNDVPGRRGTIVTIRLPLLISGAVKEVKV